MTALWLLQRQRSDAGVVDVGWSGLLGVLALAAAFYADGAETRRVIAGVLGASWAFRLCYYLLRNRVLAAGEDSRYRYLREHWGERAQRNYFFLFQGQALLAALFALPFFAVASDFRPELSILDFAGVTLWVIAVLGEATADRQLARFRSDPQNRGRTYRDGLWRFSRHPNYFFEWLHWWSYVLLTTGTAWLGLTICAPFVMLFFLLKLSGIPYTEAQALRSREDYRQYQLSTNGFFPWFPKNRRPV